MTKHTTLRWEDVDFTKQYQHYYVDEAGSNDDIDAGLEAASNAGLLQRTIGPLVVVEGTAATAAFSTVDDMALLTFCTAANKCFTLPIFAPKPSIFLGDSQEVDATQIADLIAACLGVLCDKSGNVAVRYSGGVRLGRRHRDF